MKKIYLFIHLLFLIGCSSSSPISKTSKEFLDCPSLFFASEHRVYMGFSSTEVSLDNIIYKADINNAIFLDKCSIENNIIFANLSVLFVIEPLIEFNNIIHLPYYLAVIDKNENITDIEYYFLKGKIERDNQTNIMIETELVDNIDLNLNLEDKDSSIIIGFMLDKKRVEILN